MKLKEVNRDEVDTIVKRDAPLWETVDIEKVKSELADVVRSYLSNYRAERQAFTFWMSGTRHYLLVDYDKNLGLEMRLYRIKDSKT
jgi:hypothetical protein